MSEITLQHHRTVWHFVPGLALSAAVTAVALWAAASRLSQAQVSAR